MPNGNRCGAEVGVARISLSGEETGAGQKLWYEEMRCSISREAWNQIKAAYAAGIGLREIARKMNVPEGTVLARAKREVGPSNLKQQNRRLL